MSELYRQDDPNLNHMRAIVRRYPLKILIWGASKDDPNIFKERQRIRDYLINDNHDAKFSEDFQGEEDSLIDPINDEILQARDNDAIVVLYGSRGTQSEIDRIVLPYPSIAGKTYIIIDEQIKNTLCESVSAQGWRDLLANPFKCHCYKKLPLNEEVFEWLRNEIQRRREKKGIDYLMGEKESALLLQSIVQTKQKEKPIQVIRFLQRPSGDSSFYGSSSILDELSHSPSSDNRNILLDIIRGDQPLALYFYGGKDNKTFPDFGWVELLYQAGEFDALEDFSEEKGLLHRYQAEFIQAAAQEYPEVVYTIITSIKPIDGWIKSKFLEALEKLPLEWREKAMWLIWDYLGGRQQYIWHCEGEQAARVMTKLIEDRPDQAFAIARLMLEVWVSDKDDSFKSRDARTRFEGHWYAELINQYYKKLWEQAPYRAVRLLVRSLDHYLNEVNKLKEFDISEHYYISVERIDEGSSWGYEDFVSTYMNALRDCLNRLIEHQPEDIDKALDLLRSCNKAVFVRFEIYLLSKIGTARHKERVNEIASTKLYFESVCYKNEYDLLISGKQDLLKPETKQTILGWIKDSIEGFKKRFRDYYQKDCTEADINRVCAERLYSIRKAFPSEYDKYKKLANISSDENLKPKPLHSEARWIAGDEGTPLTLDEMNGMTVDEALDYVLADANYASQPKDYQPNSPEEALAYVFQMAVKQKAAEFVNADIKKISSLRETFLSKYFYGLWDALREITLVHFDWDRYFKIAGVIVQMHKGNPNIATRLDPLIRCIQEGFKKSNLIEYTVDRLSTIFSIVEPLLWTKEEDRSSNERDPVQVRCSSVTGEALMVCLSLGVVFKRDFAEEYESFRVKLETVFSRVLTDVKTPWMVCTFGTDFPRIFWLVPEWVEKNLDLILSDEKWDTVWRAYLHWGRPSKDLFKFLCDKKIYDKAIKNINSLEPRGTDEKPAEELAKHFVIAYFNGWMESYDEPVFQAFLKASDNALLGYTAGFFTTGFESQKQKPDANVIERLKIYWKNRLEIIAVKPDEHIKEASELAYWLKDYPCIDETIFELGMRSLQCCNGKLSNDYKAKEYISALCPLANKNNRLHIIEAIRLIVQNPPEYMYWDSLKDDLGGLLNTVVNDESASPELIRAAMGLADDLGRRRVFHYREHFEKLSQRIKPETLP